MMMIDLLIFFMGSFLIGGMGYVTGYYLWYFNMGLFAKLVHHFFPFEKRENNKKDIETREIKYEEKYLDRLDGMKGKRLSEERLKALENSIVMETTPLGNVIMYWDEKREGFVYYSDATIPYRYLEVVARKYVIMNDCKEIYVDMREELKEAETRKQKRKEEQERKKEEEKKREEKKETVVKKSVFAKLKNPISLTKGKEKEKEKEKLKEDPLLIKERSNKYSCEGRIRNFSFLKKSKREVGNRMTFAEFKSGNFS